MVVSRNYARIDPNSDHVAASADATGGCHGTVTPLITLLHNVVIILTNMLVMRVWGMRDQCRFRPLLPRYELKEESQQRDFYLHLGGQPI